LSREEELRFLKAVEFHLSICILELESQKTVVSGEYWTRRKVGELLSGEGRKQKSFFLLLVRNFVGRWRQGFLLRL
jgi:hypothetical protein